MTSLSLGRTITGSATEGELVHLSPDGRSLVSADGTQWMLPNVRLRLAMVGDSLTARGETTTALTNQPTYDSATGILSFAETSHGYLTSSLVKIASSSGDLFRNLSFVRVDANNFTVDIGTGKTILSSAANWYICQESGLNSQGWYDHLRPARPKAYNYGLPGATSAAIASYSLPPALLSDANVVALCAGSNDTATAAGAATTLATITTMAEAVVAAGKVLILFTIPPLSTTAAAGAFTANVRTGLVALAKTLKNTFLVDQHAICVDPASATGGWRTGYTTDNTHFTPIAAKLIAAKVQTILDSIGSTGVSPCPASALDAYDASNNASSTQPFPKPTLITTTGGTAGSGTTGTVASGLTTFGTGAGTPVGSVVEAGNGIGNAQKLVGTPAANNDLMRVTTRASETTVAGLVVAGERRKGVCHLKVTGLTGQSVLQSYALLVVMTTPEGTVSSRISDHNWSGTAAQQNQVDLDLDLETGEFIVPTGLTSLYMDLQLKFAAAGTAVTMQASQFAFPLVTT